MLLLIGIVLFVLWILIFAVISIIWHLVAGRRATV
jgi:hypothetical protein